MLNLALQGGDSLWGSRFIGYAWNSLGLATVASLIAVGLAVVLSYGVRMHDTGFARVASRVASMGYAIPGSVVAVGILIPFTWLDNALNTWFNHHYGYIIGLVFSGSAFILLYAYVVRFWPFRSMRSKPA
ncbi:hypothetical protein HSBAA_54330 [Vreelandella sulfidaeris]|uniref:ABC transmembrane type-1 domain-containing protein n=1 Tax=Vreelandella sulfidaeris TaxID=115553 RepID=A0A455UEP6_9GAMM|nr:hypothetical protein HSBAA_54330 [Halomonas sulfidaeris]